MGAYLHKLIFFSVLILIYCVFSSKGQPNIKSIYHNYYFLFNLFTLILGEATHCWRRYDGFNVIPTLEPNKFKKPHGILCNYQCNFFIIKR